MVEATRDGRYALRLTKHQAAAAEFALEAMCDLPEEDLEELGYQAEDVPELNGRNLVFAPGRGGAEAAGDLVYRVDVQLTDLTDFVGKRNDAGQRLANRIRELYAAEYTINREGGLSPVAPNAFKMEIEVHCMPLPKHPKTGDMVVLCEEPRTRPGVWAVAEYISGVRGWFSDELLVDEKALEKDGAVWIDLRETAKAAALAFAEVAA